MSEAERPKILIVDDEEAILETMTFTFMDLPILQLLCAARAPLDPAIDIRDPIVGAPRRFSYALFSMGLKR